MAQIFSSNADLYAYLGGLRRTLADRGAKDLAEIIRRALGAAAGMSTEFLGESRIALRAVSQAKNNPLDQVERHRLAEAISQLDAAFERR
jgi:hypothetical protein